MIAEFTVENFRSFKEKKTFSLVSTKDKDLLELNTFETERNRFLRTAVIYGANASGKTSFFDALNFFIKFTVFSGPHKQIDDAIETEPFALSRQTETAPSSFEIIFILKSDGKEIRYRYGLIVNTEKVITEYLYAVKNVREVMLFSRISQEIEHTAYYKEGARGKKSVRNNCSFLSVCAQNNGEISTKIIKYFRGIGIVYGSNDSALFKKGDIHPDNKDIIINFLKFADMQITNYKIEEMPAFYEISDTDVLALLRNKFPNAQREKVLYGHAVYDNDTQVGDKFLDETVESAGTKKLFNYSKLIFYALERGTVLFIDEFDTMLHPLIIENIIKLFNSPMTNPKNAQLVISCHSVNIMTNKLLRRDQIWFCEKDKYGATDLYSLVEYKEPVRKDSSYNKNYLQGKYGAIPYIENILLQSGFDK